MSETKVNFPKISIVVPVYNTEEVLPDCLDSLRNQTMQDIEMILVDDGSNDRSGQICDEYAKHDSRITVIHKKNERQGVARNVGVKHAKGQYIMFVDSDDYIPKEACEKLYGVTMDGQVDVVEGNRDYMKAGECTHLWHKDNPENIVYTGQQYLLKEASNSSMYFIPCAKLLRREFLVNKDIWFKEGIFEEDEEWAPRVFIHAEHVTNIDDVVYYHIYRTGSTMDTRKVDNLKSLMMIFPELEKFYKKMKIDENLHHVLKKRMLDMYLNGVRQMEMYGECNCIFLFSISQNMRDLIKVIVRGLIPKLGIKIGLRK